MALSPTSWSQMTSDLMLLQPVILESRNATSAVDGATIERRIRINRPDDENTKCKVSRAWDPRKDFSQCMQQHKIPSTSNAISPQQERTGPSGHRPCRRGVKSSLRREPDVPGDLFRGLFGNVTEPRPSLFESDFEKVRSRKWPGFTPPRATALRRRSVAYYCTAAYTLERSCRGPCRRREAQVRNSHATPVFWYSLSGSLAEAGTSRSPGATRGFSSRVKSIWSKFSLTTSTCL